MHNEDSFSPTATSQDSSSSNRALDAIRHELALLQAGFLDAMHGIEQRLAEVVPSVSDALPEQHAPARAATDVALLKAAIDDIDHRRTQSEILDALVNRAASFAPRLVFFVIKNDSATGWRARGLEGSVGDASVRDITLALSEETILRDAANLRQTLSGDADSRAGDKNIYERLGDQRPRRTVAIPLVVRNRSVAVLYADSAALDSDVINLEALEAIVRVSGMAIELIATQRPAPAEARHIPEPRAYVYQPASKVEATDDAPGFSRHTSSLVNHQAKPFSPDTAGENYNDLPTSLSMDESEIGVAVPQPDFTVPETSATAHKEASSVAASFDNSSRRATGELDANKVKTFEVKSESLNSTSPSVAPSSFASPAASESSVSLSSPAKSVSTPLASSRRFGGNTELPIEVAGDEEKRFHIDARRYARLLVSEIKLYNEQKVREGRDAKDLYERLKEAIDRSREMYDKRVHTKVSARYDYFHHELVSTLAEGDAAKLGAEYPRAAVGV